MKDFLISIELMFNKNLKVSILKAFGKATLAKIKRAERMSYNYCTSNLDRVIIKNKKGKEIFSFYYSDEKYRNTGNGIVLKLSRRLKSLIA